MDIRKGILSLALELGISEFHIREMQRCRGHLMEQEDLEPYDLEVLTFIAARSLYRETRRRALSLAEQFAVVEVRDATTIEELRQACLRAPHRGEAWEIGIGKLRGMYLGRISYPDITIEELKCLYQITLPDIEDLKVEVIARMATMASRNGSQV